VELGTHFLFKILSAFGLNLKLGVDEKKGFFLVIVDNITTAASAKQLFCQNFESIKNKKCRSNDSQISLTHLEKIQFKMSKPKN
jgi:hypothetical protein